MGVLKFKDQIRTTSMSRPGDSGSCLVEQVTKKPVGLLFAGSESASFHNPMSTVLSLLSMPHINKYATGETHHFRSDYPLKIIRRTYSTMPLLSSRSNIRAAKIGLRVPTLPRTKYGALLTVFGVCAASTSHQLLKGIQPPLPQPRSLTKK